ncbi:16301_t:CDS:2, partial [Racocetra fulgida]
EVIKQTCLQGLFYGKEIWERFKASRGEEQEDIHCKLMKNYPGVIQAISNNQIGLNVLTEMVCGYVLPGRPIANVYFKCYGYMAMYQCLLLVSDLKL